MSVQYEWNGLQFTGKRNGNVVVSGQIIDEVLDRFTGEFFSNALDVFSESRGYMKPREEKSELDQFEHRIKANFFFIRGLFDYANIVPSRFYGMVMLDLLREKPFLFDPSDTKWDLILNESKEKQTKIMYPYLIRLNGFFRRRFEDDIKAWIGIIDFLKRHCSDDASNFFEVICQMTFVDQSSTTALEEIQVLLEKLSKKERVERFGMNFPYGKKAARLMLMNMASQPSGSFIRGITEDHLFEYRIPVDSQIIRVTLNTGLIDISSDEDADLRESGRGLQWTRNDFAEPCQRALFLVSSGLKITPDRIDEFLWNIGSVYGKKFGRFCFMCPIASICESWRLKRVKESDVSHIKEGCFNFGRPKSDKDFLILRGCETCVHNSKGLAENRCESCSSVHVFDSSEHWIDSDRLDEILDQ